MATLLEGYIIVGQSSVARFFFSGQKDSLQRIFIKKRFLFTVGSVCRVKRLTNESRNISLMTKRLKRRCGTG
jgi:hypothetical protein